MSWKFRMFAAALVIVAAAILILVALTSPPHCGGRGCINQHPKPAASVTR